MTTIAAAYNLSGYTPAHAQAFTEWTRPKPPAPRGAAVAPSIPAQRSRPRKAAAPAGRTGKTRKRDRQAEASGREIRQWAIDKRPDLNCPAHGRIPGRVLEAHAAAHPS